MSLFDKLEFRFGRFAIHGLMRYVTALNGVCYILYKFNPQFLNFLYLNPTLVLQGQVWRLFTYIFIPQFGSFLPEWFGAAIYLFFLWWIGEGLEHAFGAFRLNLYYLLGMAGVTAAAFITWDSWAAFTLNASLFYAFAYFYPDEIIFVMYIIPAKVKWLAWLGVVVAMFSFLTGTWDFRLALLASLANFFIFFGPELARGARMRAQVSERRKKFEAAKSDLPETLHECAVCHRTEATHPDLEFRVSSRDGQEYCKDHLPKAAPAPENP
jgi:hypothetical protein